MHRAMADSDQEGVLTTGTGRQIGYLIRGPQHGRSVVYLHGAPGCRREQRFVPDEVLYRFELRLISIDRPGYGDTDPVDRNRVVRVADVLEGL